jgi:PHD/YefM family antitoxin component YafN of YafNO toxin-antitoxin module
MSQVPAEHEATQEATEHAPAALALSVDEFAALEERVLRAVNLVKRERVARASAEEQATQVESKLAEQSMRAEQLQGEVNTLRAERDHVRQRVERLLSQLDALEV